MGEALMLHRLPGSGTRATNTVLIVDDEAVSRSILEQVVVNLDRNLMVNTFADPLEGLDWASRHLADLLLVDFQMPGINGIEFVRRARQFTGYTHVPIVMVTAERDSKVRFDALETGATD